MRSSTRSQRGKHTFSASKARIGSTRMQCVRSRLYTFCLVRTFRKKRTLTKAFIENHKAVVSRVKHATTNSHRPEMQERAWHQPAAASGRAHIGNSGRAFLAAVERGCQATWRLRDLVEEVCCPFGDQTKLTVIIRLIDGV